jgi:ophiobolin F synthase
VLSHSNIWPTYHTDRLPPWSPFWSMCLFGMDISITKAESDSVKDIFQSIDRALVLTNDYWSFDREYAISKKTGAGRIVNAVELIMRRQKLSIDEARQVVRGLIIQHEQDFVQKKEEFYTINPGISISLRRFIEVGGAIIAGNHYWCTQCPRHHSFRDEAVRRSAIPQEIELVPPSKIEEPALAEIGILKVPPSPPESWSIPEPSSGISRSPFDSEGSELIDGAPLSSSNQNSSGHGKENWQKQKHWYKPGSSALESPIAYINSMPSKGVRSALIDALNLWFQIPKQALDKIENIINILHQASIILDDIEDNSALRRSFPSAHTVYGHAQAINSANFMFVKAVVEASTLRSPNAMSIFLDDLENLYLGQSWDLYWKYNLICPTESEYLNMVDNKTGGLFRMLVRLMEAESIVQSTANLTDLTLLLGRFFQIRDDYMNLHSTIYTKQKGFAEDLDEGKFSYPVVHCLQHNSALRDQIIGIFRQRPSSSLQPVSPLSQEAKGFILRCLKKSGAMEATRRELLDLETDLEAQTTSLEEKMGEENPLLRLLLIRLSIRDEFKQSR